jgi:hypothetical protein
MFTSDSRRGARFPSAPPVPLEGEQNGPLTDDRRSKADAAVIGAANEAFRRG